MALNLKEVCSGMRQTTTDWKNTNSLEEHSVMLKTIFPECEPIFNHIFEKAQEYMNPEVGLRLAKAFPNSPYYFHYHDLISDEAKLYELTVSRLLPRGWFKFTFLLPKQVRFRLVFSIFQTSPGKVVILPILEIMEKLRHQKNKLNHAKDKEHEVDADFITEKIALSIEPFVFYCDSELSLDTNGIELYIENVLSLSIFQMQEYLLKGIH